MKKYYSVDGAEEMIPVLKPQLLKLLKLSKAIDLLDAIDIQYEDEYETIKKDVQMNKKFHEYSLKFCKEIEKLLNAGIVLKDLEEGLINFFGVHQGREIFLCWKIGKDNISTWYEADSDYEFRKPISELKDRTI